MSAFYDQASLVVVPSGYKSGKIYAQKPLTTDGQLSFTRASNATRVASNGLIEKVRTNLVLQSNTFTNAAWFTSGATITAGQPDPFGGNNAFLVDFSGATTDAVSQNVSMVSGAPYTLSVWIKGVDLTALRFNVGANLVVVTSQITNGTWVRVSASATAGSTASLINGIRAGNSLGESFFIYGAQLETGDIATDYIDTTSAAVSVGPVANVPRLDYLNSSCPRLLLEPQRTNLFTFSEQIDNADWLKANLSVTANSAVSPDGYTNADLLDDGTASSTQHWIWQARTLANSTAYTISLYAKYVSRKCMSINIFNGATSQYVDYNIQDGTILGSTGDVTASITSVGNNWYRLVYTRTMAASGSPNFRIAMADDSGNETYTGSNKQTLIYGVQIEAGAYATSYIPTLSTSVTRVQDLAYKTSASGIIGQTEGTIFVEAEFKSGYDTNNLLMTLSNTTSNMIYLNRSTGQLEARVVASGVVSLAYATPYVLTAGTHKLALAYKANDFAVYLDGTLVHSDTSGSVPACDKLNLGTYVNDTLPYNDGIKQALVFKTRLTNAQLAELTTI